MTDAERWAVASRVVAALKEHGDKWKLDEELEPPTEGAHSSDDMLADMSHSLLFVRAETLYGIDGFQ